MRSHSLERRILVALLLVFSLGFGSLILYVSDTRDHLRRSILLIQAHEITSGLTAASDLGRLPTHFAGGELSYTLYSPQGQALWFSANLDSPRRLRTGTLEEEPTLFQPLRSGRGRVISVPVKLADGSTLMVAKEDGLERTLIGALLQTRLWHALIVFLPLCLVAACLILWLLHWTLRPLTHAARLAAEIGPGNLERRIPLDKLPREIMPLARAVNCGLERLAAALETEKRLVADAAHELRTPLTVLDLRLQKSRLDNHADWPAIEREMQQFRRLVGQLLALARQEQSDARQAQGNSHTSIARAARVAVASILPLFEAQGRDIEVDIQDRPLVRGEAGLLRDAIRNVLENALFHGAGTVRLRLRQTAGPGIVLDICDEGPGVPLAEQESMFKRFRKGVQGSVGAGLGLAIVKQTLLNAGGDVRFIGANPCVVRMRFVLHRDSR